MGDILLNVTQTSANAYATVGSIVTVRSEIKTLVIQCTEKNVNAVKIKILASNSRTDEGALLEPVELLAETVIAKNAARYDTISDPWRFIDVEVASNVAATHGSLKVAISGA